jgi:hypothetical protein
MVIVARSRCDTSPRRDRLGFSIDRGGCMTTSRQTEDLNHPAIRDLVNSANALPLSDRVTQAFHGVARLRMMDGCCREGAAVTPDEEVVAFLAHIGQPTELVQ